MTDETTSAPDIQGDGPAPDSPDSSNTQQPQPPAPRTLRLKADGREEELPEEEILRLASLGRAGQRRLQEAAQTRKQYEQAVAALKDPSKFTSAVKTLGHDPATLLYQLLEAQAEEDSLSPEQRELRALKAEKQALEAEKTKRAEAEKQAAEAQAVQQAEIELARSLPGILAKYDLEPTEHNLRQFARVWNSYAAQGVELTYEEAAQMLHEEYDSYFKSRAQRLTKRDPADLLKELPEELIQALRQADVSRLKSPNQGTHTPPEQKPTKRTPEEIAADLRRKARGY